MNAFVTGSHKYGEPKLDSDVDLVVLVSYGDFVILKKLAGEPKEKASGTMGPKAGGENISLRFGSLNLIVTTDPMAFEVWRRGTVSLERAAPVKREVAVKLFSALRKFYNFGETEPCPTI